MALALDAMHTDASLSPAGTGKRCERHDINIAGQLEELPTGLALLCGSGMYD